MKRWPLPLCTLIPALSGHQIPRKCEDVFLQRSPEQPLPVHHWDSSAEREALSHGRARTPSSASLGNLKVIMATLGSVAPADQPPTRADGLSRLLPAPGGTSSKPPSLSVSQLLPLRGRPRLPCSEKCG